MPGTWTWPVGTVASVLTDADTAYVWANFVPLEQLAGERGESLADVRALVQGESLPRPSYVLDDGTEMVPADYFALADEAGASRTCARPSPRATSVRPQRRRHHWTRPKTNGAPISPASTASASGM